MKARSHRNSTVGSGLPHWECQDLLVMYLGPIIDNRLLLQSTTFSWTLIACRNMESISKISSVLDTGICMRIHHAIKCMLMSLAARELTIEAAQSAGSARSFATRPVTRDLPFAQIKKLLDSRNDREILEGLRKVISVR